MLRLVVSSRKWNTGWGAGRVGDSVVGADIAVAFVDCVTTRPCRVKGVGRRRCRFVFGETCFECLAMVAGSKLKYERVRVGGDR